MDEGYALYEGYAVMRDGALWAIAYDFEFAKTMLDLAIARDSDQEYTWSLGPYDHRDYE